ncbi:LolA family protein [Catalinimonas niigatensis]|uniref:LolA family protein n=1 Tax=Catalinimonas niigatensis TaxID=1397264 RepID=UPI00266605D5|nr:outer membrane lipoprotein carrier protein LolA [Catalinimonas niigatensis]WPP51036.1 outer membrane lipoprotein carrier protein LolA [Catalinimonas niigatensis]
MKQIDIKRGLVCLVMLLMLATQSVFAQYDPKAKEILDAMSKKYQTIGSFESDFSYSMENTTQSISEDFEGKIVVNGDKYRLKMGGQEIINDGNTVWTYLEEVNEVNIDNYDPSEGDISPTQIYNAYQRGFKYVYLEEETTNGETYQVVDLLPENTNNQFFKIRLHINKEDRTLKKWQIFDKNGTMYTYEISNFNPDAEISNAVFSFDTSKYKGVEVVDLR